MKHEPIPRDRSLVPITMECWEPEPRRKRPITALLVVIAIAIAIWACLLYMVRAPQCEDPNNPDYVWLCVD